MSTVDYTYMKSIDTGQGKKIGKYLLPKILGKGNYSTVWLAIDNTDKKLYACKQIVKSNIQQSKQLEKLLNNEVSIMQTINHPNLLHMYEKYVSDNHYYLIMDYCNQGDVEKYMEDRKIKYFEEEDAVGLLRQLMNGFVELRNHKILHRDLKLANIFMKNNSLVIGDFGFAKMGVDSTGSMLGTPMTMAPEIFFNDVGKVVYNSKADLWSLGIVFYQLLFGKWPFFGINHTQLRNDILKKSDGNLEFPREVASETKDLLIRLLTFNPKQRIEWEDFFNHPIFVRFPEKKQAKAVAEQFKQNQKSKIVKDVVFYDDETFSQLNLPDNSKVISDPDLNDKIENEIIDETISKEVFYRYSHELNKAYFLVYALKKVKAILKKRAFPELDQSMMDLSVLIVLKAITNNKIMFETINKSDNFYKVNQDAFKLFASSAYRSRIQGIAVPLDRSLKKHFDLLRQRIKNNNLQDTYRELIAQGKLSVKEIDNQIGTKVADFQAIKPESLSSSVIRDYHLLRLLINYCLNANETFRYINKNSSSTPKFNWASVYYTLDYASANELKNLY